MLDRSHRIDQRRAGKAAMQPVNRAAKSDRNFERTFRISGNPMRGSSTDDVHNGFLDLRADRPKGLALCDRCRHRDRMAQSRASAVFATTHWSVVLAAADSGAPGSEAALSALCQA